MYMDNFESLRLNYRQLTIDDSELIINWRNSPRLKNVSHKQQEFNLEDHKKWFFKTRNNRNDFIFSEINTNKPIGMISLENKKYNELSENCYELSKFIGDINFSGKGFAFEATSTVLNYFVSIKNIDFIFALTRKDNYPNIKLNEKVGFAIDELPYYIKRNPDNWIYMKMKIK